MGKKASKRQQNRMAEMISNAKHIVASYKEGLSSEQVKQRQKDGLTNKVPKKVTKTFWQMLKDNVFSFFNAIYLVATAMLVVADIVNPSITSFQVFHYIFVLPILANMTIGLMTDLRARSLVNKLRVVTSEKALVVRDGKEIEINSSEIVLSDIMIIRPGEQIPADGRIIRGKASLDESLLTGEADAVAKKEGDIVLSGTFVLFGRAYVRVEKVGVACYAETLQDSAKAFRRPPSELKSASLLIFRIAGIVAIVLFVAYLVVWLIGALADGKVEATEFSYFMEKRSSLLMAMIPAGLYLLISIALGTGVVSLARKKMNVQELYCIEMLARVDVICFDKTGTLTDGTLKLHRMFNFSKQSDKDLKKILYLIEKGTGDDNATAKAIKEMAIESDEKIDIALPFNSWRKCSAISIKRKGTYILGAPEFIDSKHFAFPDQRIHDLQESGYRVLGLYHNKGMINGEKLPPKSTLMAIIALSDHIKDDAKDNIKWFTDNGVAVKVISGDNPDAVAAIAKRVGVPGANRFISMDGVPNEEIPNIVNRYSVFGRVKPEQKALLVEAMQKQGHKVAMTGDGVNDILALKKADCSIAMASGSSAARNTAHIVAVENHFSALPAVVHEGRRVINNLQRTASLFLSKTIFAVVMGFAFLLAFLLKGPEYDYPFNANNLYIWELFTIGAAGFLLALQPSKERLRGSFLQNVLVNSIPSGITECFSCAFMIVASVLMTGGLDPAYITMAVIAFSVTSFITLLRVSWPLDAYRAFVFMLLLLASMALVGVDALYMPYGPDGVSSIIRVNYSLIFEKEFIRRNIAVLISSFVASVFIYFLLASLGVVIRKYNLESKGNKGYENS